MNLSRRFLVLLSHSNRPVDLAQCSRDALIERYADPGRLIDLPPLESLPPLDNFRHAPAGLSILRLSIDDTSTAFETIATFDPPDRKIQHACLADGCLVVCLEDGLLAFDIADPFDLPEILDPALAYPIDDPWFAGLHTVFRSGPGQCVVSASAPDAVLDVDIATRRVVGRTRLPATSYGTNYKLDANSDLRRHYVANDQQLAHLNCAFPDARGGIYFSTLIQGDIGHLDRNGRLCILSRGHIGCHAARTTADGARTYFADSCSGELVILDADGVEHRRIATGSRWLHDVQHIANDIFLFAVADRNALELIDIARGKTLLSQRFDERGAAVQFVNVHPLGEPSC